MATTGAYRIRIHIEISETTYSGGRLSIEESWEIGYPSMGDIGTLLQKLHDIATATKGAVFRPEGA